GNDDLVALDREAGIADPRIAQLGARGVDDIVEALAQHLIHVDLEQQVRAAAEVEAQADLLVREPGRHTLESSGIEQVRRREDHPEGTDDQDRQDLPGLEVEHRLGLVSSPAQLVLTTSVSSFSCLASRSACLPLSVSLLLPAGSGFASTCEIMLRTTRTRTFS